MKIQSESVNRQLKNECNHTFLFKNFQWYAGNFACKFLMFVRAFAFYLSSMTLVGLSLDRCLAIARPMAALKRTGKVSIKRRGQIMITSAWIISALCALPQTLVFRVLKHPKVEFFQCTSMGYFDDIFNNSTIVNPQQAEKIYNSLFLVVVYMVPLCVIIITYANILNKIFRRSAGDDSRPAVVKHYPFNLHIIMLTRSFIRLTMNQPLQNYVGEHPSSSQRIQL